MLDLLVQEDFIERGARGANVLRTGDRLHHRSVSAPHALDDRALFLAARVVHHHLEHEAVELSLGQGVSALLFDRVLGGEHQEGVGQRARFAGQGDLALLHRFEQCRLHLGRGPVDLVGQHEVAEDRSLVHRPIARFGVVNLGANQIGGQQIGRELDAMADSAHRARQRIDRQRLGQPRHALEQNVAVSDQADQQATKQRALADNHALDFGRDGMEPISRVGERRRLRGVAHEVLGPCPGRASVAGPALG